VQVDEQLGVAVVLGEPVRGVDRQRRLADAGHPVDRLDHDGRGRGVRDAGPDGQQPGELGFAAGEVGDVAGKVVADRAGRGRRPGRRRRAGGGEQLGVVAEDLTVNLRQPR
jgi:hypothetical protein